MKTKTIFKTLALAMLMPAMLLTTACSNSDDEIINTENPANTKGYALPVTINVTRQGDATTRATFNDGTKKLEFSAGDKLFVTGTWDVDEDNYSCYAGMLDYVSNGTFSGTIITQTEWTGTIEGLLGGASATLLPAGYEKYGYISIVEEGTYDAFLSKNSNKAFATSKAKAVEQFSWESSKYSSGFALTPSNAILNFTINGLEASTEVDVSFSYPNYPDPIVISGKVITDGDGTATFAIGIIYRNNLNDCTLTVGGNAIALPADKKVEKGKIYNISRSVTPAYTLLSGVFSVSDSKKVKFSKGNLRYASGAWSFFDKQYDYYNSYSADAWDKFGWSTSATTYGMNTSTDNIYSGDFVDWGATMGTGWFTLSSDEWTYLFNTRSASTVGSTENVRYAKAKVNDVQGMILFPDTYTHPDGVTAPKGVNATGNTGWNGNSYSSADWTKMESAGCVFLPGAGYREGSTLVNASTNASGNYWSATHHSTADYASYNVSFTSGTLNPAGASRRYYGCSIRLVRQVTE